MLVWIVNPTRCWSALDLLAVGNHRFTVSEPKGITRVAWRGIVRAIEVSRMRWLVTCGLWAGFIVLFPFYIYRSGLPQPADYVMLALIVLSAVWYGFESDRRLARVSRFLLWFVLYVVAINLIWVMLIADETMAIVSLFYAYNFMVFVTVIRLHREYGLRFLSLTTHSIMVSALVQFVMSMLVVGNYSTRQALSFNNPNQLGYFCVLGASLFMTGAAKLSLSTLYRSVCLLMFAYLAALSLSKAALISMAVLLIVSFVHRPRTIVPMLLLTLAVYSAGHWLPRATGNVILRMQAIGVDMDDSLPGRGYDRIWRHPEYLALGAGEGAVYRFESEIKGELHSTLGTILFSYGVVGFTLFAMFVAQVARVTKWHFVYTMPMWIYGLTHQGARFTLMWVLLAVIVCIPVANASQASVSPKLSGRRRGTRTLVLAGYERSG